MLKIIVSSPCAFAGTDFKENEQNLIKKAIDEGHTVTSISYLHGKLESAMGYDIGACLNAEEFLDGDKIKDGIYDAEVEGYPGKCKAYLWTAELDNNFRGLIVDETDTEGVEYAIKKYNNKDWHL